MVLPAFPAIMKSLSTILCAAFAVSGAFLLSAAPAHTGDLEIGDEAPDFELPGSDGEIYVLSDFKGKEAVVIAWYPRAFTGG